MSRKDKSKHWVLLYTFAGGMDIIQFVFIELILVWFFGIGALVNEILDPIVGIIIALWIQFIKKVSLISRPGRLISLIGTEALAALTGGIAQLWILDVWYIHSTVKKEEAELRAQEEQEKMSQSSNVPLYSNGARRPGNPDGASRATNPKNNAGTRAPGGTVKPSVPRLLDIKPPLIK